MMGATTAIADGNAHAHLNENDADDSQCTFLGALLRSDSSAWSARSLLIGILEIGFPLEKAKRYTAKLLTELGSFTAVLNASYERLRKIVPISQEIWIRLQTVRASIAVSLREAVQDQPHLGNLENVHNYLSHTLGHDTVESCRILFLNARNRLLRDELHSRGSSNQTVFYPQQLIRRAVELNAAALIVAHNHPSGDPEPSEQDLEITKRIKFIANEMGLLLHDHLIVGKHRTFSFRQAGFLP